MDKRRTVLVALKDAEWGEFSDKKIAELCAATQPFVSKLRVSLKTVLSEAAPSPTTEKRSEKPSERHEQAPARRTYTTKHGTTAIVGPRPRARSRSGSHRQPGRWVLDLLLGKS
jgi:hypothetical protein